MEIRGNIFCMTKNPAFDWRDPLIKQLGEALELSALVVRHERDLLDHECGKFDDAITAFNNWKRERGE